ncbi:hypothetical protein SAMN04488514_1011061 [Kriegella aquimaris]|uniref:Uncharacterized protein n=1 Tax=Kriegella aquimaris TaxID=192904 RepID=A0A1G9KN66_9FLAO|nr:hypothetical protein SAMN04488514_1011061 [Kriegella aquimaris]
MFITELKNKCKGRLEDKGWKMVFKIEACHDWNWDRNRKLVSIQ